MKALAIILVVIAIGILVLGIIRARNFSHQDGRSGARTGIFAIILVVLLLLGAVWAWPNSASADGDDQQDQSATSQVEDFRCPDDFTVADVPNYQQENPNTQQLAASGGTLVGDGPALDTTTADAAANDLLGRTQFNPLLTAKLANIMRLSGFVPGDVVDASSVEVSNEFINERSAELVSNHTLWAQTRKDICLRLGQVELDSDPYKDRPLFELATRVQETNVNGIIMPVTNVNVRRDTQPDGVRLLWINRNVDSSGERPNKFPIAVDTQFVWPVIVGEIPENVEQCLPPEQQPEEQQQQNESKQQQQEQQNQQGAAGSSDQGAATNDGGGSSGGSGGSGNGGCGDCKGGGDTGGGSGNGGDGSGGCAGCGGSTTTQPKPPPTNPPPTSPPTTRPPTTTTTRPPTTTTTRPPTTTTTKPPTPPTTKAPDPGCDVPGFCD